MDTALMARYSYHRLDANHDEIRQALEDVGCTVDPGGPLDLIVGRNERTYLLEIKTAKGKLRPKQVKFLARWKGHAATVRTVDEALRVVGVIA